MGGILGNLQKRREVERYADKESIIMIATTFSYKYKIGYIYIY
jgi:hypothetical protein